MTEPAKVFEDRIYPGNWRVEWEDDDGGVEVTNMRRSFANIPPHPSHPSCSANEQDYTFAG